MLRQESVFSLVMEINSLVTAFTMIRTRKSLEVGMWSLMREFLYKDKSNGDSKETALKRSEFVNLDILEFTPQEQQPYMGIPIVA